MHTIFFSPYPSLKYFNCDLITNVSKSAVYTQGIFFNLQVNKPLSLLSYYSIVFHHIDTIFINQLIGKHINYQICWNE
jgi:hypothetical protein